MITREEYNKALDIVEAYHKQLFIGVVNKRFEINQKVIWDGMYYFVIEINEREQKVLLANVINPDHPQYDTWWVNTDEVNVY